MALPSQMRPGDEERLPLLSSIHLTRARFLLVNLKQLILLSVLGFHKQDIAM
jgi:hypothetical protein